MDLDRVASRDIVEQLWEDVRRREATLTPLPEITAAELRFTLALRYLNLNWPSVPIEGPFGASRHPRHRVAGRIVRLIVHVLTPVLARDEEFRAHLVRVANESAVAHDDLLREVSLLRVALEDRTARMSEHTDSTVRQFDARLAAVEQTLAGERSA